MSDQRRPIWPVLVCLLALALGAYFAGYFLVGDHGRVSEPGWRDIHYREVPDESPVVAYRPMAAIESLFRGEEVVLIVAGKVDDLCPPSPSRRSRTRDRPRARAIEVPTVAGLAALSALTLLAHEIRLTEASGCRQRKRLDG